MLQKEINVLITSAGTASAVSVIKALKLQTEINIRITAVDTDPLAPGLFLADSYRVVPPASNPNYINELIDFALSIGATILIPIYSKEIELIAQHHSTLLEHGIQTLLPAPEVIALCNNKTAMNACVTELGIQIPRTYTSEEILQVSENVLPVFAKPNSGSSSTGAQKFETLAPLKTFAASNVNFVFQEFIDAEEVTVDVFCDSSGTVKVIAPRLRLATKGGQSTKGKTVDKEIFEKPIHAICSKLGIKGACNIQFFIKDKSLYFIEVNPRFAAGGLMLTVKSGANIPLLLIKEMLDIKISDSELICKPGIIMTRYWEEIIIEQN